MEASQDGVYFSAFMQENLMPRLNAMTLANMQDEGKFVLKPLIIGDNDGVFRAGTAAKPITQSKVKANTKAKARAAWTWLWCHVGAVVIGPRCVCS